MYLSIYLLYICGIGKVCRIYGADDKMNLLLRPFYHLNPLNPLDHPRPLNLLRLFNPLNPINSILSILLSLLILSILFAL